MTLNTQVSRRNPLWHAYIRHDKTRHNTTRHDTTDTTRKTDMCGIPTTSEKRPSVHCTEQVSKHNELVQHNKQVTACLQPVLNVQKKSAKTSYIRAPLCMSCTAATAAAAASTGTAAAAAAATAAAAAGSKASVHMCVGAAYHLLDPRFSNKFQVARF
jgi:hypothetical protein